MASPLSSTGQFMLSEPIPSEKISVLVIDDDDVAVEAITRALRHQNTGIPVISAADGSEALRILRGEEPGHAIGTPLMILLDLNMAGMNGLEFLGALRADPRLHHNVVFVWTTSDSSEDRYAAYSQHIAGYILKSSTDRRHGYLANLLTLYQEHVSLNPAITSR